MKEIQGEDLIDRRFAVVSAGLDHIHLRELGTGLPVDIKIDKDIQRFIFQSEDEVIIESVITNLHEAIQKYAEKVTIGKVPTAQTLNVVESLVRQKIADVTGFDARDIILENSRFTNNGKTIIFDGYTIRKNS